MRIYVSSVFVNDQEKALKFYTEALGFVKKKDIPVGEYRWLTVASPNQNSDVELLLEPSAHPAVGTYRDALVKDGIPLTSFAVENIEDEHKRLESKGVEFTQPPTEMGGVKSAVFNDTCGNLVQIVQLPK